MSNASEQLTYAQAIQYARQAGFSAIAAPVIAAIAAAESSLQTHGPDNINLSSQLVGTPYYGSRDRGVLQINNVAHPDISDNCAYDPACAFKAAFSISGNGTNFNAWSTYSGTNPQTGRPWYAPFLGQAQAAANGLPTQEPSSVPVTSSTGLDSEIIGTAGGSTPTATPAFLGLPGFSDIPIVGGGLEDLSNLPLIGTNWWAKKASNAVTGTIGDEIGKGITEGFAGIVGGIANVFGSGLGKSVEGGLLRVGLVLFGAGIVLAGLIIAFTGTDAGKATVGAATKAAAA